MRLFQYSEEIQEHFVALKFGNVFHAYDFGLHFGHQAAELVQQAPFGSFPGILTLGIFGKRLAGRAADQDTGLGPVEMAQNIPRVEVRDTLGDEACAGIVVLVGEGATRVDVISRKNGNPGIQKSAGQSARAAE